MCKLLVWRSGQRGRMAISYHLWHCNAIRVTSPVESMGLMILIYLNVCRSPWMVNGFQQTKT